MPIPDNRQLTNASSVLITRARLSRRPERLGPISDSHLACLT